MVNFGAKYKDFDQAGKEVMISGQGGKHSLVMSVFMKTCIVFIYLYKDMISTFLLLYCLNQKDMRLVDVGGG